MALLRDRRLAERPAPVDGEAFLSALYAEHGAALLAHARRLTGDEGRAEDAVQETLLRAWKSAGRLTADDRPLRPWLFTVLSHVAVSDYRARRARPLEVGGELTEQLPAPPDLDRALEAWQLQAAVRQLSLAHREVLLELYFHGRSVAEAAEVLGVPAGTVKSRSFYALRALRLVLEEAGWRDG